MLWESENRAEQCRILQIGTVDAGNGTLFGTRNKRAIQRDHLTLVIGSGGMGAATIHAAVQRPDRIWNLILIIIRNLSWWILIGVRLPGWKKSR